VRVCDRPRGTVRRAYRSRTTADRCRHRRRAHPIPEPIGRHAQPALLHRIDPYLGLTDIDLAAVRNWLEQRNEGG